MQFDEHLCDISTVLTVTARRIPPCRWKIFPERGVVRVTWAFLHCGIMDIENFVTASRRHTGDIHNSACSRFVYDTYKTMEANRSRHGWVHMFITHRPTVTLQLHNFDLFRTCRTSSFCTVAWQLARFQLTRHIARSLDDSWASCRYNRRISVPALTPAKCQNLCLEVFCRLRKWHTLGE